VRIAYLCDATTSNAAYRSIGPLRALEARGHELRALDPKRSGEWDGTLRWCELLHLHRACEEHVVQLARGARERGAAVVWDDDDDITRVPRRVVTYREVGGLKGTRLLAARAKLFEAVDLVTTPSAVLADVFREGGARDVRVIENYVIDELVGDRKPRRGMTIGWVAAVEHRLDAELIPIADALGRLLEARPDVRVTTIGVELALRGDRYAHVPRVPLPRLLPEVSAFDVGIAPLSPRLAINLTRSNVKLKEYAAVGVPWLASPVGPYAGVGEKQGGRLVADDRWFDELDALAGGERARRKLAKRAARWGREQLLSRNVGCWESAFADAIGRVRAAA
jgi:hypothetical protein